MADQTRLIRVFLASPGDVIKEREAARRVIDEIGRTIASHIGVRIEIIGWDTHSFPAYGGDPQSLLNAQIAEMAGYDLFVGILWNRMGTPTPRARSGTEEEFRRAVEALERSGRPQIMLYFGQAPMNFTSAESLEQKGKVVAFRKELQNRALLWDYSDPDSFERTFREHFTRWLTSQHSPMPPPPVASAVDRPASAAKYTAAVPRLSWILLKDRFLECESVSEHQNGSIIVKLPDPDSVTDAILRSFQTSDRWRRETVPYAFENNGGLVDVKSAERSSQGGHVVWTLSLQLDGSNSSHVLSEMGFNNVTADEIATMRARLLLLNEEPRDIQQGATYNMLKSFVSGLNSPIRLERGVFPKLWKEFRGDRAHFISLARLLAVFHLKVTNTVEHIIELDLGPVHGNRMRVHFRGQRHQIYSNRPSVTISVDGDCELE